MDNTTNFGATPEFKERFNKVLSYFKDFAKQNNGEIIYSSMIPREEGGNIIVDVEDVYIPIERIVEFRTTVELLSGIQFLPTPQRDILRIVAYVKP